MEAFGQELLTVINNMGAGMFQRSYDLVRTHNEKIDLFMDEDGRILENSKREIKNVIVASQTQVGKTQYLIDAIKRRRNDGEIFVISCDNYTAQLNQMIDRLNGNGIVAFDASKMTPTVASRMLVSNMNIVIVMLNNCSQIKKMTSLINGIRINSEVKRMIFFHDEGDTVNKTDNPFKISDKSVAKSHRMWDLLFENISSSMIPTTRFWISATPENCSSVSKITGGRIIVLPVPEDYRGVSDHRDWTSNGECIKYEVERIRELDNGEVILHCVDKKNVDQDGTARVLSRAYNCVSVSYNGKSAILYKVGRTVTNIIHPDDSISTILDKTRELCSGFPLIVVGYNLMSRGVSFVGSGINPPTATVLFNQSGVGAHVVGLAQRYGRITGTSRPDLRRRIVYCPTSVYEDYKNYLDNQRIAYSNLKEGKTMAETVKENGGNKIGRPLDRDAMENTNNEYKTIGSERDREENNTGNRDSDTDTMKTLVNRWKIASNNDAVARLFRRMVENGGRLESNIIKNMIGDGPLSAMTLPNHPRKWKYVFRKDGLFHYIREEALAHYNTL